MSRVVIPRIQRGDPVVEPLQPGLSLTDYLRLGGPVAIARDGQVHRADIGEHRLAGGAVTAVPAARPAGSCLS